MNAGGIFRGAPHGGDRQRGDRTTGMVTSMEWNQPFINSGTPDGEVYFETLHFRSAKLGTRAEFQVKTRRIYGELVGKPPEPQNHRLWTYESSIRTGDTTH